MGTVSTIQTTLADMFAELFGRRRRSQGLLFCICAVGYLLGLPLATNVSLQLIHRYTYLNLTKLK